MVRTFGLLSSFFLAAIGATETLLTDAKVIEVTERGFALQVGTQPLIVEDTYQTKFWLNKSNAKRDAFKAGDAVSCRIKTDADPPQLREMADRTTAAWLESIRKDFKKGTIEAVDSKFLTMKFEDGSQFAYRATDKSAIKIKGKSASVLDLEPGQVAWAKGRLLPTLDTFLVELTDAAPAVAAKEPSTAKGKVPKMQPLRPDGVLEGMVTRHHAQISMFDIETDRMLHITYTATTKFTLDGQPATKAALRPQLRARINYKRDKAGRLIASKVDLTTVR